MKDRSDASDNGSQESEPLPLKDLVTAVKGALQKRRHEVVRSAKVGKLRLDLFQARRDRASLFERLGRELYHLLQEEALPQRVEFQKPFQKLQALESRIQGLEDALIRFGEAGAVSAEEEGGEVPVSAEDRKK